MNRLPRSISLLFWLAMSLALVACPAGEQSPANAERKDKAPVEEFAKIRITDDADHLLFTYLQADGSFQTVDKIADVPKEAREQVMVVDTSLTPEQRRSAEVLYVADLTTRQEDGTYPYSLVGRYQFERNLLRAPAQHTGALPPECASLGASPVDHIVLYTTSWCGVCKAAIAFLKKEGIPFEEKDIEEDLTAKQELTCKALKSGKQLTGVPVMDVAGTLLVGFDRDHILAAARKLTPTGPGTGPGRPPSPAAPPTKRSTP